MFSSVYSYIFLTEIKKYRNKGKAIDHEKHLNFSLFFFTWTLHLSRWTSQLWKYIEKGIYNTISFRICFEVNIVEHKEYSEMFPLRQI